MTPPLVRMFAPPIEAPSTKVVRKLRKKCNNLLCHKANSPQAVEGKYLCFHCHKGTYTITAKEAADSTSWSLLKQEFDFKEGEMAAKEIERARMRERRRADAKLVEERQKRKEEEKRRAAEEKRRAEEETQRRAEEEQRRAEAEQRRLERDRQQMKKAQCDEYERLERLHEARKRMAYGRKLEEEALEARRVNEAAAREARRQREAAGKEAYQVNEEAERQPHAQEVVQRQEVEPEKMIRDARTQERRNKQNASPPNLERRRAQRRHVESPPPDRGHSACDAYAPKPHGYGSSHNVNPPAVHHHHHASRPSGSDSAQNSNLPIVRDYHASKPSGARPAHNVNAAIRDHHAPKPSGSRSAPGVNPPPPHRPPRPSEPLFPHVQLDDPPFRLRRYPDYF